MEVTVGGSSGGALDPRRPKLEITKRKSKARDRTCPDEARRAGGSNLGFLGEIGVKGTPVLHGNTLLEL
ncbi:hypothetical protein CRG98_040983 [Punica granatum]|uniref:Uncharacterized protein n=1 Tax=Punica granatum TaxID=22663 RepID=A0A2I0I3X1_PUNGR|nr:hypothetical protein CRG98_040983 [Punica granatum]